MTTYTIRVADLSEAERMLVRVLTLEERRDALLTAARSKGRGDTAGDTVTRKRPATSDDASDGPQQNG